MLSCVKTAEKYLANISAFSLSSVTVTSFPCSSFAFVSPIPPRFSLLDLTYFQNSRTQPTSRDLLLNFGTVSRSPERLKLEISNLVSRSTTGSTIEKVQNQVTYVKSLRHVRPTFKFWDCLHISGTAEAKNFKLCAQIDHREYYRKHTKLGQNRCGLCHLTHFYYIQPSKVVGLNPQNSPSTRKLTTPYAYLIIISVIKQQISILKKLEFYNKV